MSATGTDLVTDAVSHAASGLCDAGRAGTGGDGVSAAKACRGERASTRWSGPIDAVRRAGSGARMNAVRRAGSGPRMNAGRATSIDAAVSGVGAAACPTRIVAGSCSIAGSRCRSRVVASEDITSACDPPDSDAANARVVEISSAIVTCSGAMAGCVTGSARAEGPAVARGAGVRCTRRSAPARRHGHGQSIDFAFHVTRSRERSVIPSR
ncbi:hypothetical protein GORHZ_057_00480 [Gordonia rhizosphera NBRC 16068]|uniref:Uncharacterized protein n=1 Tax=Gordonia rhizosphera NBRC 16068 TaxID=1108045 RepID=K6W6M0_9ACTN|nr:hypothetical protein GORHZ_057_00480 [Gordonia rhizosphera NBRC 16068]